ncbi:PfkB family carbohydrate kinase [Nonomuraea endophytica]|uniref:PfkB family carbohydrate kinase n=1 Tax=Nonomuraea endophytica TaxID=714136 RepID=UPI0037C8C839
MASLGVIGNISIDTTRYPDGRTHILIGGAALYVSLAAGRAGALARPVAVIGDDLGELPQTLDLTHVSRVTRPTCRFEIAYGTEGQIAALTSDYGAATELTTHALAVLNEATCDLWHVCCRRPLAVSPILERLVDTRQPFSLDFHIASATEQISAAKSALPFAEVIFVNTAEYRLLKGLVAVGELKTMVVSDGPREVRLIQSGRIVGTHIPERRSAVEVTGAGDTLAGTFLAACLQGASKPSALATAVGAATQQVCHPVFL